MNKYFTVFILLLAVGCNQKLTNIFDISGDRIVVNEADFDYLTAKAKIDFEDGAKDISGIANIRMRKDSVLWISLSPGFGVEVVRALITTDSAFVIDKINKQYLTYSFEALSKKFDFDLNFKLLQSVILGNLIYPYKRERLIKSNEVYTYNQQVDQFKFENIIGATTMKLEKLRVDDTNTQNSISVTYGDFQLVEQQILPFLIKAQFDYAKEDKSPTKVGIEFKQSEIEKKPLKFPFNVPSKYDRI
ncbi:MAG: DUF4292 domain-containing protein [Cyclobacteriaceae bacterium]